MGVNSDMSMAKRALTGTFFVAVNSYLSLFIYFVSGVILARLLSPADFGVFRISLFYVDLFGRVKEFGLDKALIHKQEDLPKAYRTHFTLQFSLSVLGLLVSIIFSPIILKFYSPPVLAFIIAISISYIFQSLSATQRISLEKNLLFSRTAVIDIASLIISSLLSVVLAFKGYGALSLVVGYGSNFILSFIFLWALRPWKVKISEVFLFDKKEIIWFLKFGSFLFVGGLTTFILYKYNDFILGTFLSVTVLGFYSRAFNYAQIPTSLITSVVSKVALPTYAALQNDRAKLSEAFSIVLKNIVRISFPFSILLYIVADDFTAFLLGPKWLPMVPIFRILLIYGVFRSIFDDLGELFTAVGKPKYISFYLLIQALVSLLLSPVLTRYFGAQGSALSLSLVLIVGVLFSYSLIRKVIVINIVPIFLPTISISLLTLLSFEVVMLKFNLDFSNSFTALFTKGFIFGCFYFFYLLIIDGRSLITDLRYFLSHLTSGKVSVDV